MPKFVLAYHGGGIPETPEESQKAMQAWGAWFGTMGDALIEGGSPVGVSKTVSVGGVADNGGANPLSGYSIITAQTMDSACEIAGGCPIIADGSGTVEVAPVVEM